MHVLLRKIGKNKNTPRVWLEGRFLSDAGFTPGIFCVVNKDLNSISLKIDRVKISDKTKKVSSRPSDPTTPIIDINSVDLLNIFEGHQVIRVIIRKGRIDILPVASETRRQERNARLMDRLKNNLSIRTASVSFGGGICSHAIENGLKEGGIVSQLAFANDIREELLAHASENNDIWTPEVGS